MYYGSYSPALLEDVHMMNVMTSIFMVIILAIVLFEYRYMYTAKKRKTLLVNFRTTESNVKLKSRLEANKQ
jgi:hypothetical protein